MRGHADQKRENSPKSHLAMRGFLGECWSLSFPIKKLPQKSPRSNEQGGRTEGKGWRKRGNEADAAVSPFSSSTGREEGSVNNLKQARKEGRESEARGHHCLPNNYWGGNGERGRKGLLQCFCSSVLYYAGCFIRLPRLSQLASISE